MSPCLECGGPKERGQGKRLCTSCRDRRGDNREWHRNWYHANKTRLGERIRVNQAQARARRAGREATLTLDQWEERLEHYGYRCAYCFGPFECLEHVRAVADGGGTTADNCVPACLDCNARKGAGRRGHYSSWTPSIASEFWPRLAEELYA